MGESGLIARVAARLPRGAATLLGVGDDAAVVRAADGRVVVSTDLLVEGVHFRRDWSSAYDVGRKAAAQNLIDVAAMGATPTALLLGLAAPADLPVAWCEELADGVREECAPLGVGVVGGDTVAAADGLVLLAVTALGDLGGRSPVTRSGAREGDVVVLAGLLGRSTAGLELLRRGDGELLERHADLVEVHRHPRPPYAAGPGLADLGASAMCDISDGLLVDVGRIALASGLSVDLQVPPVPAELAAAAAALGADPVPWVLAGGEDHALVATLPGEAVEDLDGLAVVVGAVRAGSGVLLGGQTPPPYPGFEHFGGSRG